MPITIQTMADFIGLEAGQIISLFGREALYLGSNWVKICGCADTRNMQQLPQIIRARNEGVSGNLELIEIRFLEKRHPQKISGITVNHTISKDNPEYLPLKRLLINARLIPEQARILNALTTKSGMIVKPVWHYETNGRISFREQRHYEETTNLTDLQKTLTNTGISATTLKEAYEKSTVWAAEN
ncbi:MAG: hypothetical protein PHF35_03425 [Candidatus Moranbacteria bacterium]|nr:hypothetical protein [Candidatus Moranbacteria bacterium]